MVLRDIQQRVNEKLAGEMLRFDEMITYLDSAIDDINNKLNSTYPVFSEFNPTNYPNYKVELYTSSTGTIDTVARDAVYNNYDLIPDKYIRSVVIPGAAFKWFTTDEEGASAAPLLQQEYELGKFEMLRDFIDQVPIQFINQENTGALRDYAYYHKFRENSNQFLVF